MEKKIDAVNKWTVVPVWNGLLMLIMSDEERVGALAMMCYKANRLNEPEIFQLLVEELERLVWHVLRSNRKDATLIVEVFARGGRADLARRIALSHPRRDSAMVCAYVAHSMPASTSFVLAHDRLSLAFDRAGLRVESSRSVCDYIMTLRIFVHSLADFTTLLCIVDTNEHILCTADWDKVFDIVLLTMCWRLQCDEHKAAFALLRQRCRAMFERICAVAEGCLRGEEPESAVVALSFLATHCHNDVLLQWFENIVAAIQSYDVRLNRYTIDLHSDSDGADILSPLIVTRALDGCRFGSVRIVFGRGNHRIGSDRARLGRVLRWWLREAVVSDDDISIRIDLRKARQLSLFQAQAVVQAIRFALRARRESPGW